MTMQAGEYWIGDLCYCMNPQWSDVCDILCIQSKCGEFTLPNGVRIAIYQTKYGDGTYLDSDGNGYSVDSGTIGCIRLEDIDDETDSKFMEGGNIHEFDEEFETSEKDGQITFGEIVIETDDTWIEEPSFEDDEDEKFSGKNRYNFEDHDD
jgi:hypothetical protein